MTQTAYCPICRAWKPVEIVEGDNPRKVLAVCRGERCAYSRVVAKCELPTMIQS